jgi:Spy/CpxP family protein refolding chaperone
MFRASALLGTALLGVAFVVGTGASQDTGKSTTKTKAYLPVGWKDLGLSKEQTFEISKVHATYKAKIKLLEDQIKEAKTHERQDMVKLLTADQKDKLRRSAVGEDIGTETKTDTTKDKAKAKDKN